MPVIDKTRGLAIENYKDENDIGVGSSSSMRSGLSRKVLDAVSSLTRHIDEEGLDLETGFVVMSIMLDSVLPYVNVDTKATLDSVYAQWQDLIADQRRQKDAMRISQENFLASGIVVSDDETAF